ncbi:MAG: hypothetical protein WA810_03170 [Maribacter sp.]
MNAQSSIDINDSYAFINVGRSFTGTGDLNGLIFGVTYGKYMGKKFNWDASLESTLHDNEEIDYFFTDESGNSFVGKSRYVTGGFQLVSTLGYTFSLGNRHELGLALGPLVRYQSSSVPDAIGVFYPAITGLPRPVQIVEFTDAFKTISLGGTFRLRYHYKVNNALFLGLIGGLQTDTNGDTISYYSLLLGRRF